MKKFANIGSVIRNIVEGFSGSHFMVEYRLTKQLNEMHNKLCEFSEQVEQQYDLLQLAREYIVVRDPSSRIIFWNRGAELGYGWTAAEAAGVLIHDLLQTRFPKPIEEVHVELYKTGYWQGEVVQTTKNGSKITVASHWTLKRDRQGKPHSILEINHNITEVKALEKSLQLARDKQFRAVFDSMYQLTGVLTPDGILIDINKTALSLVGCKYSNVVNRRFWDTPWWNHSWEAQEKVREAIKKAAQGDFVRFEVKHIDKNDNIAIMDFSIKPVFDETGKVTMLIPEARDITAQKNFEQEMARLSRLDLVGEMAAAIGHEVRNPMTTVRGYLQMLQKNDPEKSCYKIMIDELDRANLIISEYLSLAKNKSSEMKLNNIAEIVNGMNPLLSAATLERKVNISISAKPENISPTFLDEKEIRQLILNLFRNALEASPAGGVVAIDVYQKNKEIVLSVQDQGQGIPKEMLDKLGTPFFTTKPNGTGLGLAVCYRIVTRHNAAIRVKSDSKGTKFDVIFPVGTDKKSPGN